MAIVVPIQKKNVLVVSAIGIAYGLLLFLNAIDFISFLPPCLIKYGLGIECFACGTNRAILAIFHGDLINSWQINPMGILVSFSFLLYLGYHLIHKNNGH